jgi:hypothetical protein
LNWHLAIRHLLGTDVLVGATIVLIAVLFRVSFSGITTDDAYITLRYARNLVQGLGFVYNAGERVLGTTTPLYTIILAAAGRFGLDMPLVGKWLNILAEVGTIGILFRVVRRLGPRMLAWGVAFLFAISPYNVYYAATGMETGIYIFLLMLLMSLYSCLQSNDASWWWFGIVAGLLVFTRMDGLLAIAASGFAWLITRQNKHWKGVAQSGLAFALVQVPWLIFATVYFGSPVPHSITAKALTYQSSNAFSWLVDFLNAFAMRGSWLGGGLTICLILVGLVSVFLVRSRRWFAVFPIWFILYVGVFTWARAGRFGWYYAPLMPLVYLFIALAIYDVFRWIQNIPSMARALQSLKPVFAVLLVPLLLGFAMASFSAIETDAKAEASFEREIARPLGNWLRAYTSSDSRVALESIGAVGWYSERYIVDEGGLVSERIVALNRLTPGDINILGILQAFTPDYYVAWKTWELEKWQADPVAWFWLSNNYKEIRRYEDGLRTWILFERRGVTP